MDSLVPVYIFMLLCSVALVFFHLGKTYCNNENKIEYRFIPRTHEELEQNTSASDVLRAFV